MSAISVSALGLRRLEAPRSGKLPGEAFVKRDDAQSAIVLGLAIEDHVAAWRFGPGARDDVVIGRLAPIRSGRPTVFGAIEKAIKRKEWAGRDRSKPKTAAGRPAKGTATGGEQEIPDIGGTGQPDADAQGT